MFAQLPNTLFEWALAFVGGSALVVFVVALQHFFLQPATLTRRQRLIQELSIVVGVTHGMALLVVNSASDLWAAIGVAMYCGSLALFLSAIESARQTPMARTFVYEPECKLILSTGPYRVIRHPIYLAYSLAWLAAPVAMHSLPLGLTAAIMIVCYVVSAREEERRLTMGPLAAEYLQYRARTWRVIPFIF